MFNERKFILCKILDAFSFFSLEQHEEDRAVTIKHFS